MTLRRATLLLAIALAAACAPAVQSPARPSENEARNAAPSLPSKPTPPNPAPEREAAPEATQATNDEPVQDEEPDTCPPADAGSQGPREVTLREPSSAAAPSPELMRRLTVAQKAELRLLGELCETSVRAGEGGVEVGCSCCPPFDECGPVRGGRPRGGLDAAYPMVTQTEGSFTAPGVRELAVTFFGCEPHSSNWGGTALYRREKDAWSLASYTSGVRPDRCQPYRLREGRDVLICQWSDAHQSIGRTDVFAYDFVAPDRKCWTPLVDFVDDSSLCEGEPGKTLTSSNLDRVQIRDVNRDGILDVRVEGRSRSGLPSKRFQDACMAKFERQTPPTRAQLEREKALLGPLERLVFDFVSDGRRFALAPK
jgi:hypothetical protein